MDYKTPACCNRPTVSAPVDVLAVMDDEYFVVRHDAGFPAALIHGKIEKSGHKKWPWLVTADLIALNARYYIGLSGENYAPGDTICERFETRHFTTRKEARAALARCQS